MGPPTFHGIQGSTTLRKGEGRGGGCYFLAFIHWFSCCWGWIEMGGIKVMYEMQMKKCEQNELVYFEQGLECSCVNATGEAVGSATIESGGGFISI